MVKKHFTSSRFNFEQNFTEEVEKILKNREITRRTKCHDSRKQLQAMHYLMGRAHRIYWKMKYERYVFKTLRSSKIMVKRHELG